MHSSLLKTLTLVITILATSSILSDNGKPDLWRIEKDGTISYLFGSIHVGSEDYYPLSEEVNTAYRNTDNLVVEFDLKPGDEAKMIPLIQKYGLDTSTPLEQKLSPETLSIFKQVCKKNNLPCAEFAPLKTWLVSLQLSVMKFQQLGYNGNLGIDKHFLALAHASNKNVISLETAESQFQMLDGFNQEEQELMLVNSLQETDKNLLDLVTSWKSGDDDLTYSLLNKNPDNPVENEMLKVLIDDRNINMASQISEYIKANKSLFVVVGYGHVISKNGIVELLKKDGFTLTLIQ